MIKFIKELMLEVYRGELTDQTMDDVACTKSCPYITAEGFCPVDFKETCPTTDEEVVNSFLKQRLASYNGFDESMNELLEACGFEE